MLEGKHKAELSAAAMPPASPLKTLLTRGAIALTVLVLFKWTFLDGKVSVW